MSSAGTDSKTGIALAECVHDGAAAPYVADFWTRFFEDGREFAEIVRDPGIVVWENLDYFFGVGMKPSYGGLSQSKAGRLFDEWRRDPARFETERPRKVIEAVLEWGRDAEADERREREAWERLEKRLPAPPPGYGWVLMTGGLQMGGGSRAFILWSASLGYPPTWE